MRKSSRSWLLPPPSQRQGDGWRFPSPALWDLHPPWPGPNQGDSCPTGDQVLDRKRADTVREVNQALPEVQKSHSFRSQTPSVLSSQGWAFLPNINNRFPLFKNEIQNKALWPRRHRGVYSFAFSSPPKSPSAGSPPPHTCPPLALKSNKKIPRTQVSPNHWHHAPALQTGLNTRHNADLFLVVHKLTRKNLTSKTGWSSRRS